MYVHATTTAIHSVRYSNPGLPVWVVTDAQSYALLRENHPSLLPSPDGWKVVEGVEGGARKRSRYLKTRLRHLVDGKCVFLDGDVLVRGSLRPLFGLQADLAAAVNHSTPDPTQQVWSTDRLMLRQLDWETSPQGYFNTGVLFLNDTEAAYRFWDQWHHHWKRSVAVTDRVVDQPAFNHTLSVIGGVCFEELPIPYNAQLFANLTVAWAPVVWHFYTNAANTHHALYLKYIEALGKGGMHDPALVRSMCRCPHPWNSKGLVDRYLARRGIRRGYLWPVEELWLTGQYRKAVEWWIENKRKHLRIPRRWGGRS